MAYTDTAKIKAMLKDVKITSSTSPATTDVNQFIVEEEAVINGMLSEIYVTPITGAQSVAILSKVATLKVSQRIKDVIQIQGEGDGKDRDAFTNWSVMADKIMKDLLPTAKISGGKSLSLKPKVYLTDATLNKGHHGRDNSIIKSGPPTSTATKATFVKGVDGW